MENNRGKYSFSFLLQHWFWDFSQTRKGCLLINILRDVLVFDLCCLVAQYTCEIDTPQMMKHHQRHYEAAKVRLPEFVFDGAHPEVSSWEAFLGDSTSDDAIDIHFSKCNKDAPGVYRLIHPELNYDITYHKVTGLEKYLTSKIVEENYEERTKKIDLFTVFLFCHYEWKHFKHRPFIFNHCHVCHRTASDFRLKSCGSCLRATYCSKVCQREHWYQHKEVCRNKLYLLDNEQDNYNNNWIWIPKKILTIKSRTKQMCLMYRSIKSLLGSQPLKIWVFHDRHEALPYICFERLYYYPYKVFSREFPRESCRRAVVQVSFLGEDFKSFLITKNAKNRRLRVQEFAV